MQLDRIRPSLCRNTSLTAMQVSLQKALSEYKRDPSSELLDQIISDVMVANALGYISNEVYSILEKLLEKERKTKWH